MFNNAEYPESWGLGYILPIFKGGDPKEAKNYRGITLNSILKKIYSQVLLNRLTSWSEKFDKISNCQFGYQKGKSTIDCIFLLHSIVSKVLSNGQKLYAIFIDYEKCFDKINHMFLWQKLISENVGSKMTNAIKAMYSIVRSVVKHKQETSDIIDIKLGVKQGDPSSSLLFMLFVNDIIDNINSDLDGIFTINEIKLFLIMFADDQVLFATNSTTLQSMLTNIKSYCNTWKLKINVNKTKVLIFEKGNQYTNYDFYLYNEKLEVVSSFKYLGINFFKNGNWHRTQKCISEHASKAMHRLFSVFHKFEFSTKEKCKLFDQLVSPVLNYSSEIWGLHNAHEIESIHTKFLRKILGVRKSTNLISLYGETGRVPLQIIRKLHMFRYWIKILQLNVKQMYQFLKDDAELDRTYDKQNWAYQIKSMLESLGLPNLWINQEFYSINISQIKLRLFDQYHQSWYSAIVNSKRLKFYSRYKHTFNLEPYFDIINERKFQIALCRFRLSSHNLEIERGRYQDLSRDQRLCKFCTTNMIENEYHFLLVCPAFIDVRRKYLKPYIIVDGPLLISLTKLCQVPIKMKS